MLLGALLFAAAAHTSPGKALAGDWGGQHVRLAVLKDGAEVEFDCGHGSLDEALAPDKNGRFSVKGSYVPERGGPTLKDEVTRSRTARYEGTIAAERMSLKVVIDDGDALGPFELTRGGRARLIKCR